VIWILWALLLLRLVWKVFDWSENYFVITSQRLLLSQGFLTRKVNMMPLAKVTDMSFQRSAMGQLLGYGEFIVESAGQDQALRNVDHLPHPEQLYLEVCGLIFKEQEETQASPDNSGCRAGGGAATVRSALVIHLVTQSLVLLATCCGNPAVLVSTIRPANCLAGAL
jgi:uncharacterized membrane protein YdbT with pleckstrin-like domain